MVDSDELRRLLKQTREHNVNSPRLTEAEYDALPNPHQVALNEILDGDDRPDRVALDHYVREVGNDRAPMLLHSIVSQGRVDLSDPEMGGIVASVWTLGEPFKAGVDAEDWIAMFRANGYTHEGRRSHPPTDRVTVYRGSVPDRRIGMSWTTDYATAKEFACDKMSSRGRGNIYRATLSPHLLLAYIHDELGRGEDEYVVDQKSLDPNMVELVAHGDEMCS